MSMKKEVLGVNQTKAEFVKSIHDWLMRTLKSLDREEYQKCFKIEGSSIMCELPDNFFDNYEIPSGTRIEMKFITKKS